MELEKSEIQELLTDTKRLLDSAQDDLAENRLGTHQFYVSELNSLLERAQNAKIVLEIRSIKEADRDEVIPNSWSSESPQRSFPMRPSAASKTRKLREIITVSDRLLNKIIRVTGLDLNQPASPLVLLENLFRRFHIVVSQLRVRRETRSTLDVEDEYDVQDLLHALLRLHFEDIRREEWTPSYAGGSARMDFLLKAEQLVVEAKKTRKGLTTKEIGEQLIIDIEKYSKHPDCKTLVCFVYDPEGRIANPRGVEADLNSRSDEQIHVLTFIKPSAA